MSNGILPLVESGVINNSKKAVMPGKIVTSFAVGNRKLYDFIDDNPVFIVLFNYEIRHDNMHHIVTRTIVHTIRMKFICNALIVAVFLFCFVFLSFSSATSTVAVGSMIRV